MSNIHVPLVVVGSQWGDEGKGKIVDLLSKNVDCVVRFNGGNNAGHTIIYKGQECKLHILPSGIFEKKKLMISQGAVFDPEVLLTELKFCKKNNLKLDLLIDYRVHLVMPYHRLMDAANEKWKGKAATGSLHLGIGYCYEDRNNRAGIRCEDLLFPKILKKKIFTLFPLKKAIIEKAYGAKIEMNAEELCKRLLFFAKILKPYIGDVSGYISRNVGKKKMLFEGAMGTMLDGVFGTYPYTVANNTIASSLFSYVGIPGTVLHVIGLVKAYTTRVGGGPFPTEQKNSIGDSLQKMGKEFGATSGRKRRCGWLDLNIVRYAHRLNHFNELTLTKLDVLSHLPEILVCVAYKIGTKTINEYPAVSHEFYRCKPIYKKLKGWKKDISKITKFADLPKEARMYVKFIEKELKVPVKIISVGAERKANIII